MKIRKANRFRAYRFEWNFVNHDAVNATLCLAIKSKTPHERFQTIHNFVKQLNTEH